MQFGQGIKEIVNRQIPVGGCVADVTYLIGAEILTAVGTYDYVASTVAPFVKRGCVAVPPLSGDVPAVGAACHFDASTKKVQATPSATTYCFGTRDDSNPADDGVSYIGVDLDGTTAAVYGVPGDIQGVTAGTGLTGGGTSGAVTLAIDTTVVARLAELASIVDGKGVDLIGSPAVLNTAFDLDGTAGKEKTLHALLLVLKDAIDAMEIQQVEITVALGATSGASAASPALVGADVIGFFPVSGNDQPVKSIVVGGDGAVTLTTADAETAQAVFKVSLRPAA